MQSFTIRALVITGLVLGVCGAGLADDNTSIVNQMNMNAAAKNKAADDHGPGLGDEKNGDSQSNDHTGSKGRGAGGDDKNGNQPPQCVPEPASMLVFGAGAGIMALRRKLKKS